MLTGADIQSLKDYVSNNDGGMQAQGESTVRLHVTHSNLSAIFFDIRLDRHMTIGSLKAKLGTHCGTQPGDMELRLLDQDNRVLAKMEDDSRKLGYYSPEDGWVIRITDSNPHSLSANGGLEDTSLVQKYVMSDEDYDKRGISVRKAKKEMQEKEKEMSDKEWAAWREEMRRKGITPKPRVGPKIEDDEYQAVEAEALDLGGRCQIQPGDRRGVIRYVGRCAGMPKGYWVGVECDEPLGRNDGSVQGQRYFQCHPGYGAFVRPGNVTQGDFAPADEDDHLFSDEDEI